MFLSNVRKFLVMSCILSLLVVFLGFSSQLGYGEDTNLKANATLLNYNGTNFSLRYPASWSVLPSEKVKNGETFVAVVAEIDKCIRTAVFCRPEFDGGYHPHHFDLVACSISNGCMIAATE